MRAFKTIVALAASAAFVSAAPPEQPPGRGVLCLGTFVYFAEKTGKMCRAGLDADFQARLAILSDKFDAYIIRNTSGTPDTLSKFKASQNLDSEDRSYICEGDAAMMYDHFRAMPAADLDKAVDELLARDGPPSFGDCV
ncbi:hypothetical protein KNJ79_08715 [Sphingopyxis indica]|uniref:hypothetical protein n=1 Tax=Sphingopyxis indica TaxID=436663 RepID=UPI002938F2EE|nr:hypothetical protein [Sphingopyxis indica]WOF44942.1 hypothetical protein KNJ79_08715 [Sphingopyxis indica]